MRNKKSLFPLVTIICWVMAASVMAYDSGDVDGLNGGLNVQATLTDSPCSLSSDSSEQIIDMGNISKSKLSGLGALSQTVPIYLILEHCFPGGVIRSTEHGGNIYWLPDQPVVMMNVIGEEDPTNPRSFRVYGDAKGISLHLEDSEKNIIIPGERSRPQVLNPGRNYLIINAQLIRTIDALKVGEFRSVINIGLEYH